MKVVVLPTINASLAFASVAPLTRTTPKIILLSFLLRKWRLQASATLAAPWHAFGSQSIALNDRLASKIYSSLTSLTTRISADEYWLKTIKRDATAIEFVYPPSVPLHRIKAHLARTMADADAHSTSFALWFLSFPFTLYLSKFLLVALTPLFAYQTFRIMSHFRAHFGAQRILNLNDSKRLTFTPDPSLETHLVTLSKDIPNWSYSQRDDLHDDLITKLAPVLGTPDLLQTYRRTRWESFWHDRLRKQSDLEALSKPPL